jgi:hypothetical protein
MLPAPPRPEATRSTARPYVDPSEHLGDLLELARTIAARAIARAWPRGALAAAVPGARPGEVELRALSGDGGGDAGLEPGTGKTMVAGAIARELGLDLFRVDLARVTSKWIGETEKNLGRIFDAAEDGQAVILFDEADSLFSKRTAVKEMSLTALSISVSTGEIVWHSPRPGASGVTSLPPSRQQRTSSRRLFPITDTTNTARPT